MKFNWKSILSYIAVIVFFLVLSYGFVPQVLDGKIVDQGDISGYLGMAHETNAWNATHPDDKTAWTNSMFGGMPTTMLTGNTEGDFTQKLYDLCLSGKRPASYLFISLLGAFLMMLALGINPFLAAGGAIAVTFCSYNMQIIQVGHNAKMVALAFAPYVLAAVIYTYRKSLKDGPLREWLPKVILGAALFGMALNFQIKANHVQITYYLAIIVATLAIVEAIYLAVSKIKEKWFGRFAIASSLLLVMGLVGIGANTNRLIPTYLYTQQTMRGGSELSSAGGASQVKSKGLDLSYATAWSYAWEELPNLMIPNYNGGASVGPVNPDKSATVKLLRQAGQPNVRNIAKALPMYWGPQSFTAGPMYMGAITVFLFLLGLLLYKGREKWWLLIPTLIAILLALGNHFMLFTKFWYNYMPFYSKFRTVSMALVVLQLTLPMLGFLVLDRIVKKEYDKRELQRKGLIAWALTAGFCLLCYVIPSIAGDFISSVDAQQPEVLADALRLDRIMLLRSDALTSFVLISLSFVLILWGYSDRAASGNKALAAGIAVCVIASLNLLFTGKRYLNSGHFVRQKQFTEQFALRGVDDIILKDKSLDYRVLDLTVNVFNDSHPSYYHKNIGGYSPVKLQRYQDLIDRYLTSEINSIVKAASGKATLSELEAAMPAVPILSALNDKYIILGDDIAPLENKAALGNCWFVSSAQKASTPDEEIALIGNVDLGSTAVLGPDFASVEVTSEANPSDTIALVSYAPNQLVYNYSASSDRTAVLSEIYYPNGWSATLEDGTPIDIFRADWTLRGLLLPAGNHSVTLRFEPRSYAVGSAVARPLSLLLIILLLAAAVYPLVCQLLSLRKNSSVFL